MISAYRSITVLLATAVLIFTGCTSATRLTSSWSVQDGAKSYQNLAVVAITKSSANRGIIERAVATELRARGIPAIGTLDIFPFADKMDLLNEAGVDMSREGIEKIAREKTAANNIDALMIISLLDKKTETEQRGGNFGVSMAYPINTYPYYGYGPYGYYSYAYTQVYSPSYEVNITTYIVETNLYDVATERLIWSAVTETKDPASVSKEAAEYAKIIADQMIADNALKP